MNATCEVCARVMCLCVWYFSYIAFDGCRQPRKASSGVTFQRQSRTSISVSSQGTGTDAAVQFRQSVKPKVEFTVSVVIFSQL